jgi:hypothetical protein
MIYSSYSSYSNKGRRIPYKVVPRIRICSLRVLFVLILYPHTPSRAVVGAGAAVAAVAGEDPGGAGKQSTLFSFFIFTCCVIL